MRYDLLQPFRMMSWGLAIAILALSFVPPDLRPETGAPRFVEHFFIYVAAGTAFGIGYSCKQGVLAMLFLIFAGSIEAAQLFVPGRHARLSDLLVNVLARYIGLLAVSLVARIRASADYRP